MGNLVVHAIADGRDGDAWAACEVLINESGHVWSSPGRFVAMASGSEKEIKRTTCTFALVIIIKRDPCCLPTFVVGSTIPTPIVWVMWHCHRCQCGVCRRGWTAFEVDASGFNSGGFKVNVGDVAFVGGVGNQRVRADWPCLLTGRWVLMRDVASFRPRGGFGGHCACWLELRWVLTRTWHRSGWEEGSVAMTTRAVRYPHP